MSLHTGILLVCVGIIPAFWGYRLYEMYIGLLGALLGCSIGVILVLGPADPAGMPPNPPAIAIIFVIILAIVGYYIAMDLYQFIISFSAFIVSGVLTYTVTENHIISLIFGSIFGYLYWVFHKFAIVVTTAMVGGFVFSLGVQRLVGDSEIFIYSFIFMPLIGIVYQLRSGSEPTSDTNGERREKSESPEGMSEEFEAWLNEGSTGPTSPEFEEWLNQGEDDRSSETTSPEFERWLKGEGDDSNRD